ncbi:MAG: hypothetical protein SGBAC_013008 [Bacillariaceae sp.]
MKSTKNNNSCSPAAAAASTKQKELFDLSLMKERSLPVKAALFASKQQSFAANAASSPGLDDSSVSSMGSCTSALQSSIGSTSVRRRSLFSKYWVTTGESPVACAAASTSRTSSGPPTAIIEIADDQISQEESRNVDPIQQPSTSPVRRSLFSQETRRSVSLDYLMQAAGEDDDHHRLRRHHHHQETASSNSSLLSSKDGSPLRHKSEGELVSSATKRRPSSCLRESRFSFSKQPFSSERSMASSSSSFNNNSIKRSSSICSESSSSFVQFDMESNEVRHFLKPTEVHAEEGWTNYFY